MPNGHDRNWVRVCAAVDGFRINYGRWPTRVRIFAAAIEDIRENILTREAFERVGSLIEFVPEDSVVIAEDDEGASYNYGESGFPETQPDVSATEWFGNPDYRPHSGGPGEAIHLASQPNYLGDPQVVYGLMQELLGTGVECHAGRAEPEELHRVRDKLTKVFCGEDSTFTIMPGWHKAEMLGDSIIRNFEPDRVTLFGEPFNLIVADGLHAVILKLHEVVNAFLEDEGAVQDRDLQPVLEQLHSFATAVFVGINDLDFPDMKLKDIAYPSSRD